MALTDPEAQARLLAAYRDAELDIIRLVAQALRAGNKDTAAHYADNGRVLQRLIREVENRLRKAEGIASEEVITALQHGIASGFDEVDPHPLAAANPPIIPEEAVARTATEVVSTLASVTSPILRTVNDVYRTVARSIATRGMITGVNRVALIQDGINTFASQGVTAFVDASGRRWSLDTYTEMVARTAMNRARNQGRRQGFVENSVTLIVTSAHRASAPQCLPYQGKVLSLDGQTGPRRVTTPGGEEIVVDVVATLQEAEENGYHHVNCRHTDTPYIPGVPLPEPIDTGREDYAIQQRQRGIERNIRKWKRREAGALTDGERAHARGKVREWQKLQREHIAEHPWLTRRYDRERLFFPSAEAKAAWLDPKVPKAPKGPASTPTRPAGGRHRRPTTPTTPASPSVAPPSVARTTPSASSPSIPKAWTREARTLEQLRETLDARGIEWKTISDVVDYARDGGGSLKLAKWGQSKPVETLAKDLKNLEYLDAVKDGRAISPLSPSGLEGTRRALEGKINQEGVNQIGVLSSLIDPEESLRSSASLGVELKAAQRKQLQAAIDEEAARILSSSRPLSPANLDSHARLIASKRTLDPSLPLPGGLDDAVTSYLATRNKVRERDLLGLDTTALRPDLIKAEGRLLAEVKSANLSYLKYVEEVPESMTLWGTTRPEQGELPPHRQGYNTQFDRLEDIPRGEPKSATSITRTVNPNYAEHSGYKVNCVRVTASAELQRRGYNIPAGHSSYKINSATWPEATLLTRLQSLGNRIGWDNADYALALGWRTKTGEVRGFFRAAKGSPKVRGGQNAMTLKMMEDAMPDGARGFATCDWQRSRSGHIWNWEKINGKIVWYEYQSMQGEIDIAKRMSMMKRGTLAMVRTDDLVPTDDLLDVIGAPR